MVSYYDDNEDDNVDDDEDSFYDDGQRSEVFTWTVIDHYFIS